jgi:glycosyltransferase involved in cell wall biosynthesis
MPIEEIKQRDFMASERLCIVTHTFLPHVGGIERVVYEQSKRLMKKRRFDLSVLTHRNYTPPEYEYDGIPVKCYDALNIGFRLGIPYPIPNITSFETFLQMVKSSTIVHAHGHPYLSSLISGKLAKRYNKPFILTQHNTFIEYNGVWDQVEKINDLAVGKQTLKEARKIIVISDATRRYVLSLGAEPEKIELLYNGVDVARFRPSLNERERVRKRLGISEDASVVVTVRRLVYKNGIDTLLSSAMKTIRRNPKIVFLVIGKGPDFVDVKARISQLGIKKNFLLTGFISDEELPSYYNAADFFVLPSKSGEGLPLVALEAMSCGLPIIATDVGGIREVIIEGFGKIVPPNNPAKLAEEILELSGANLTKLRQNLRKIIIRRHSWDVNVAKLEKIYEEII